MGFGLGLVMGFGLSFVLNPHPVDIRDFPHPVDIRDLNVWIPFVLGFRLGFVVRVVLVLDLNIFFV
jgi:hypothetical protein